MSSNEKVPQFMPWVGKEEYGAIAECFENNWITEGPKSKEFLKKLLDLIGARYGVLAPNGTLAIYMALKANDIGPGDEVIVPDFSFIASASAVIMAGARPIFNDVNKQNFQIDLSNAEKLVSPKTKAVMPVHIYGTIADMDMVSTFAERYGLMIIEDAAQALGVHYKGRHAGTFGKAGTFSFFADKTITTAEGGLVTTNDENVYQRLLYLRNQGRTKRGSFVHPELGFNFRITDLQSAIGLIQLDKLEQIKQRKLNILKRYQDNLSSIGQVSFLKDTPGAERIPFRVGILCDNSQSLLKHLQNSGIEPRTFFYPLHKQPAFSYLNEKYKKRGLNMNDDAYPNSVFGFDHGICLPTFPTLSENNIDYVCNCIQNFYA